MCSVREVILTRGMVAVVDDADYESVNSFNWCAAWNNHTKTFYAMSHMNLDGKRITVRMHRLILGIDNPKIQGDHRNGDTLDNRRDNLRIASNSENGCNRKRRTDNSSGFKGVRFYIPNKKWLARIGIKGKRKHLGYFLTREEAYIAYKTAALSMHGEFARVD